MTDPSSDQSLHFREGASLLAQLEQRAAQLEADNHRLRRQITRQDDQIRDLTDTLDAARATNRDLMNQLNRGTARQPRPEPRKI